MPDSSSALTRRWIGPLLAPFCFMALLGLAAWAYSRSGLVNPFIKGGLHTPVMVRFAVTSLLREALPLYVGTGLLLTVLMLLPIRAGFLGRDSWHRWSGRDGFVLTMGLLGFVHLWLWWAVPSTMWVLPGVNRLPFALAFPLLLTAFSWAVFQGFRSHAVRIWRKGVLVLLGLGLAWGAQALPLRLARVGLEPSPSGHPVKVLMLSLDGLRQDTAFEEGFRNLSGFKVANGYTAIPATRMMWSLLWGGNPRTYTLGHVMPSQEELEGKYPYDVLRLAKVKGLRARFYIDDGGTIGLADRSTEFDRMVEPARGWENFLNSNLSVHLPLYAVWMDALRIFPTTTPWTPVDLGVRRTLEDGRGADWVMYHSCLAHQPIFLTRAELNASGPWWTLRPRYLAPLFTDPSPDLLAHWNPVYSSYGAYRLRIRSILGAWGQIWNGLGADPDYGPALRLFMTDHGERFFHVNNEVQLGGVHGYNLDPWQCRIPLAFDGPGVHAGLDETHAVSLLRVRDQLADTVLKDRPLDIPWLLTPDKAFMRMYAIDMLGGKESEYRQLNTQEIIDGSLVFPEGSWGMTYKKSAEERALDVSVGEATGTEMRVFRPLKKGGARVFYYQGYTQMRVEEISEEDFQKARVRIGEAFLKTWDGRQLESEAAPTPSGPRAETHHEPKGP